MRRLAVALVFCAAAFAQAVAPLSKPNVSGRVFLPNGDPIHRVIVTLLGKQRYSMTTGENGAFAFSGVAPGTYALVAQRPGYSAVKYGAASPLATVCFGIDSSGSMAAQALGGGDALSRFRQCINGLQGLAITVTPNAEIKDLKLQIAQTGVIRGTVTNLDLDAVSSRVTATVREPGAQNARTVATAFAGTDGSYTLDDLPPGRLYLQATPAAGQIMMIDAQGVAYSPLSQDQASNVSPEADVSTYYPSASDERSATPVEVKAGEELRDVDIVLRRAQVFSVRGALVMPPNTPATNVSLALSRRIAPGDILSTSRVNTDGGFVFRNVTSGEYIITCRTTAFYGIRAVSVIAGDLDGVTVTAGAGIKMTGTLRAEGAKPEGWPNVTLSPTDGTFSSSPTRVQADGTITFLASMAPTAYLVRVTDLPLGTYLKSVRCGDQDALHNPLNLEVGGAANLEILISSKVAVVSGKVTNAAGGAVKGAQVIAWPVKPETAGGIHAANTDQNGEFEVADLGPGDYFVAAWEYLPPALAGDAAFLARFQSLATPVNLAENGHGSADLKLIPREKIDAEVAKLP